jgi:D-sedoheptulose 7-phosphate isomerase
MRSNTYNFKNEIKKQIEGSIAPKKEIIDKDIDVINDVAVKIIEAYKRNKKTIWFGNGGSAADAQHLACELVSKFILERKAIPSIALTTNTSILTAVSNDYCYDEVFERQIEAFAEKGDILIGITTSGNSLNVIKGLKLGKKKGAITVAFTGRKADKMKDFVDYIIAVPSDNTPHIQESHIMIGHIICYLVEKTIFGDK